MVGFGRPPKGEKLFITNNFSVVLPAVAAVVTDLTTMIAARDALPAVAVPGVGAVIALAAGSCCLVLCVGGGIHYLAFR